MIRFLALAPLLAVWASGATLPDPRGGELRVAIKAEPRSLDPLLVTDEPSQALRYLTGGVLIRMNRQTQRPEPALAERWSVSRDGKKIVFQLRGGLRFSDGTLCGARDVEAALARVLDPKTVSPAADAFRAAFVGARVERTGDRGITLSFDRPVPGFERYFDEISITGAGGIRTSAGPFYLAEHTPGVGLTLARNPHYWKRDAAGRPLPYLERVRLEVIQNRDVELLRFRKGELDLMNALDAETFDRLRTEMPGSAQDIGQSLDLEQLWFNQSGRGRMAEHKRTWFRSREFRLGVSAAIAREDLARVVYRGHARPAYGPVSPANQFWFHGGLGAPRTGTEAALAHFRKAGFRLVGNTL
ncbi:MAG TPA: hypothetical protein DEH78_07425, partial [Solibacterales bacterium]|nr:hypothetical protein [Bryobacterales bacterium]